MRTYTVIANSAQHAKETCAQEAGFYPDDVREVDSGNDYERAWKCFESSADAELWDKQI